MTIELTPAQYEALNQPGPLAYAVVAPDGAVSVTTDRKKADSDARNTHGLVAPLVRDWAPLK
jgi:hypothetical protein